MKGQVFLCNGLLAIHDEGYQLRGTLTTIEFSIEQLITGMQKSIREENKGKEKEQGKKRNLVKEAG